MAASDCGSIRSMTRLPSFAAWRKEEPVNTVPQISIEGALAEGDLWYKDAVFYQLHVKAFADSNNDGVGDFAGLTERLDYLQNLGVTALWLLPFYPSPGRDDGYDIADYRKINPDFGGIKDFRRFMQEAKRRDLRVITELVINHTSDEHPWFKRARRSKPGSDARNWYVWSDTDHRYSGTRIIFSDSEKSNWAWDPVANAYYWHRFFSHQPDLNFDNPRVLWALVQVMRRWLDLGVDGFRLDAIPYLCERDGTNNENLPETHAIIKKIRSELDAYAPGRLLLAEANQWPEDVSAYFGDNDECHMAYHFPLMPRIYMAIAQEDRFPITDILRQTPDIPDQCQWALFLRNHDELTLEMVTDNERDYLWSAYAADPRARINLGIRRRLAPLMENDRRKIELMNSLLLSFPGTPIIYYGDEIGMGDNIYLGDRNGVRTPMQWTPDRNGGFSRCDPARLYLPMIMDPVYGYQAVNVEAQSHSLSSLLSWMKRLISVRKSSHVFGRGILSFIRPSNRAVLVYVRQHQGEVILCVANLSRSAQAAEIDLSAWSGRLPLEMLGRTRFPRIGETPYVVTLAPYGFFWFQLIEETDRYVQSPSLAPEFVTLVMSDGWPSLLLAGRTRQALEREVLPAFLTTRRWFADKGSKAISARIQAGIQLRAGDPGLLLALVEAEGARGSSRYVVPLEVDWNRFDKIPRAEARMLAAIRRGAREGTLLDAAAEPEFLTLFLDKVYAGEVIDAGDRKLEFLPTERFRQSAPPAADKVRAIETEQSNTTAIIDSDYVVKIFRRVHPGANPEIEVGRFLTDDVGYTGVPPLLGSVELVEGEQRSSIAVVTRFVENQGDAWTVVSGQLDRFVEEQRLLADEQPAEEQAPYSNRFRHVGRRTAELHLALASRDDIAAFAPESITPEDVSSWTKTLLQHAERTLDDLAERGPELKPDDLAIVDQLNGRRQEAFAQIARLLPTSVDVSKIRHHGDLHLGQMLIVKDDILILDFEGEPQRSLEERRQKRAAARDVAGVVRSIDYAATAASVRAAAISSEGREKVAHALDTWRERTTAAFLAGYRETMVNARLWPVEPDLAERILDFFLLEKAFYEIDYEVANRPSWLHVPLSGVWRILSKHESSRS
jgi:maltose alpha-D-glucosyltransferase/alpha-amylase